MWLGDFIHLVVEVLTGWLKRAFTDKKLGVIQYPSTRTIFTMKSRTAFSTQSS